MSYTNILRLRIVGLFVLGLFLVESFTVDTNGCVLGLREWLSSILLGATVCAGIVVSFLLLVLDTQWWLVHLGSLVIYLAMLFPAYWSW